MRLHLARVVCFFGLVLQQSRVRHLPAPLLSLLMRLLGYLQDREVHALLLQQAAVEMATAPPEPAASSFAFDDFGAGDRCALLRLHLRTFP